MKFKKGSDMKVFFSSVILYIPRNRVTLQVLTWLYSLQTEIRYFSDNVTLITGLWCTVNVWNNWGDPPTVSGCWTITLTAPDFVPYAISIQFPDKPTHVDEFHEIFGKQEQLWKWICSGKMYKINANANKTKLVKHINI